MNFKNLGIRKNSIQEKKIKKALKEKKINFSVFKDYGKIVPLPKKNKMLVLLGKYQHTYNYIVTRIDYIELYGWKKWKKKDWR